MISGPADTIAKAKIQAKAVAEAERKRGPVSQAKAGDGGVARTEKVTYGHGYGKGSEQDGSKDSD